MNNLKRELDHQIAGIAWSLWKELGVAGIDRFHENCLVQPEELIIMTLFVAEYDPRLSEEALDWLSRYHDCISVSRLRTLLKNMDPDTLLTFSHFAAALNAVSGAKWPDAAQTTPFKTKLNGKSLLPSLDSPSLLMLRMRSLFGPGAKADTLTHFLTRSGLQFSAADLVEIGYSKKSIMAALDHLAASGVMAVTLVRNKKNYELKRQKELQVVIGKLPKIAPPWNKIIQAISMIRAVIPELQKSSETTGGVIFRNCLKKIEPLLPFFVIPILQSSPVLIDDWKALIKLLSAYRSGNFFMQFEVYDEFEKLVIHLLQLLYPLDDCIDGIESISYELENDNKAHAKIYKECYQLFASFVADLQVRLNQFLEFPFHKMMDESLADIVYRFLQEKHTLQVASIEQITSESLAIRQYRQFMPKLHALRQFVSTFRKQLEELYFVETKRHLLSLPDALSKRHLVHKLFSSQYRDNQD
jgi:hypothetical protein